MAKKTIGFSAAYRLMWIFMMAVGVTWGILVGASIAGSHFLGPTTIVVGSVATIGLSATLFVAGRKSGA